MYIYPFLKVQSLANNVHNPNLITIFNLFLFLNYLFIYILIPNLY